MTKRERQLLFMWGNLSSAMWEGLLLLDKGRLTELRRVMTEAIEESDKLLEDLESDPLDMEEILRENSRRQ